MAFVERTTPVGTDILQWGTLWQIAGVSVDNPTGSWLNIPDVGDVPPYTLQWTRGVSPTKSSISVVFAPSPAGTPSQEVGRTVKVTIFDSTLPDGQGYPAGAAEIQLPGRGDIQYLELRFAIDDVLQHRDDVPCPVGFHLEFVTAIMGASVSTQDEPMSIVSVFVTDGGATDNIFPPLVISPEQPSTGIVRPIPRVLPTDLSPEVWGKVPGGAPSCGVLLYLEFYEIRDV